MFAAFMAARPLIKFGIPVLLVVLWSGFCFIKGYEQGKSGAEKRCLEETLKESAEVSRQAILAKEIDAPIVRKAAIDSQVIVNQVKGIRKKAVPHDTHTSIIIDAPLVYFHDSLSGMPDQAEGMPSANDSPGQPEVSQGRLEAPDTGRLQVPIEGRDVTLTPDELKAVLLDVLEKYALIQVQYAQFTEWNDSREAFARKAIIGEEP